MVALERLRAARLARRRGVDVGDAVRVGPGVRVEVARGARLTLEDGCMIGSGTRVLVRAGAVVIGAGAKLGEDCRIVAHERVALGAGCVLGPQAAVMDAEPATADAEMPVRLQGLLRAPVTIGANAVLGPGAVVLAGATVPDGARLGARTVTPSTRRSAVSGHPEARS
jgi:acetyltransferase-like isoleucine patch superfamily enzyme